MKKIIPIAISILLLCSIIVGIVEAGNAAYSLTEYVSVAGATVDGKWTTADEWDDAPWLTMSNSAEYGYNIVDFTSLKIEWIIEFFADNTNDAGDYWQICLDGDNSGGTAPQTGDLKIEITGHTTLKVYQGNGSGWTEVPGVTEIQWANTRDTSKRNNTQHWILELSDSDGKTSGTIQTPQPPNGMRVAAYDASTGKLAAWPPGSSADVPDQYGVISGFSMEPIPEGLSLEILAILSTAVVAGAFVLSKRTKSAKLALITHK